MTGTQAFSVKDFIAVQSSRWEMFARNLDTLNEAWSDASRFSVDNKCWEIATLVLSYRKASVKADLAAIERGERPCFLCSHARPVEQLISPWHEYEILVNPYPLAAGHLTIPSVAHEPQRLSKKKICDMLELARYLSGEVIFYNGPRCGASAPDHFHFQAIEAGVIRNLTVAKFTKIPGLSTPDVTVSISQSESSPFGIFRISSYSQELLAEKSVKLLDVLPRGEHDDESPVNLFAMADDATRRVSLFVIPRRRHRPSFYGESEGQLLVSPASLEMAGIFVTPRADHASRLSPQLVKLIYNEVAYSHEELAEICNLK